MLRPNAQRQSFCRRLTLLELLSLCGIFAVIVVIYQKISMLEEVSERKKMLRKIFVFQPTNQSFTKQIKEIEKDYVPISTWEKDTTAYEHMMRHTKNDETSTSRIFSWLIGRMNVFSDNNAYGTPA